MKAKLNLMIGSSRRVGERSLIPIMETSLLQRQDMTWAQIAPIAIVVVEEKRDYLLSISKEVTLKKLNHEIPTLKDEMKKERNKLKSRS